jgi:hypothetical protein
MQAHTDVQEIFKTAHGAMYQCNRTNRYLIDYAGNLSVLKVEDFLILKKLVDGVNLEEMAQNPDRAADFAIISPFRVDRCFVLTLTDVVNLKELLAGTKVMLELNSLLRECLYAAPVYQ